MADDDIVNGGPNAAKSTGVRVVSSNRSTMDMLAPGAAACPIKDPVKQTPVVSGPRGKAWLCNEAEGIRQMGFDPEDNGGLAHWVVEAPWAHPAWHSYSVVLVHLRPLKRPKKTLFYRDDATHEIWVYALDPTKDRNQLLANGIVEAHWLSPKNFASQFVEPSDDAAKALVQKAVQEICDGVLSPDVDFQSEWHKRFGDCMMKDRPNKKPPTERWD